MNHDQIKKYRDKYLAKLKIKQPLAFQFYDNPVNFKSVDTPNWGLQETSKKPLTPYNGPWTEHEVIHLLKRTRVGVTSEELDYFAAMSMEEALDQLMQEVNPSIPVNNYSNAEIIDPDIPFGESIIDAPFNGDIEGERIIALKTWFINELIENKNSIHPVMWLFWHNHLVTESWGIYNTRFVYKHLKLLHDSSLGNFKELIKNITTDVSMLIYLNGTYNSKEAPDENYSRELQELFCLGKGPNSNYTEGDVQAAARVLTGWKVNWDEATSSFATWDHDTTDKQFSAFYNNQVITGKTGNAGAEETDELIDMIFDNDETALFICRKLYTFFVFANVDEWAEENIIVPLAQTFRNNNFEIVPVLKQLLSSDHFYDELNRGTIIKSPVDCLLGFWRTAGIQYSTEPDDIQNQGYLRNTMLWTMSDWGQQIGDPPNVAGWPAYYQVPTFDKSWVTTSTITRRLQFTDSFVYWGFWSPNIIEQFRILEFTAGLKNPEDPNELIAEMARLFLGLTPDPTVLNQLKSVLLSGQAEDYYWTNAWTAYIASPDDETLKLTVENRLKWMFQRFFQLAEFQLK